MIRLIQWITLAKWKALETVERRHKTNVGLQSCKYTRNNVESKCSYIYDYEHANEITFTTNNSVLTSVFRILVPSLVYIQILIRCSLNSF